MTAPAQPASKFDTLSFKQATAVLDSPVIQRAYLLNAITVGVHMVNEAQQRDYSSMLRILATSVEDNCICFNLFEGATRVALMCYNYDAEDTGHPVLEEIDDNLVGLGPTSHTEMLQPVFDHVLAKMENQVWSRVQYF